MLILAGAAVQADEFSTASASDSAAMRKATRNMRLAVECLERALIKVPDVIEINRDDIALIVGTNSGELSTSSEFLLTLSRSGMARPMLFQNSLHNATAGFLSIHFGLTGPVFTVSSGENTPGECIELARMSLAEEICRYVAVVLVEVHRPMMELAYPQVAPEGAACLVLGAGKGLQPIGTPYDLRANFSPLFDITASGFFQFARRGVETE